jgi:mRNA-degrading endonuclease toxin of MazEF toxin-antitoxin module
MMLRRGCVHWANTPGEKRRPVLLLSPEARNDRARDVIVVPLTSVLREGPWHVRLRTGEAGIAQADVVQVAFRGNPLPGRHVLVNASDLGLSARWRGLVMR